MSDLMTFQSERASSETGFLVRKGETSPSAMVFRISAMIVIGAVAIAIGTMLWARAPMLPEPTNMATVASDGIPVKDREAIKGLICTIRSANDAPTRMAALQRMNSLAAKISVDALREIEHAALRTCLSTAVNRSVDEPQVSWRHDRIAPRKSTIVAVALLPGDLVITGLYEVAILTSVYSVARLIDGVIHSIGDLFIGIVSMCFWCLALRLAFMLTVILLGVDGVRHFAERPRLLEASAELLPARETSPPEPAAEQPVSRDYLTSSDHSFRS